MTARPDPGYGRPSRDLSKRLSLLGRCWYTAAMERFHPIGCTGKTDLPPPSSGAIPCFSFCVRILAGAFILLAWGDVFPSVARGFSRANYQKFQRGIVEYRHQLNPRFKKKSRKQTRLIIVHTSELGLSATLRVVSKGKQFKSGYKTPGGHAHYVIARNGTTYRMLGRQFRADHAGLSMWNRQQDISSVSIGIELVGYHYAAISAKQYRSVALLLDILQKIYGLRDTQVLTHSQVAYGRPNRWFRLNHRGRKRCAKNFEREKAGLGPTVSHDPDVRARRLLPDPQLAALFYGKARPKTLKASVSNLIAKDNSAWSIAGEDYDQPTTVYVLPDGRMHPGDRISDTIGWQHLPRGTRVLLNQDVTADRKTVPGYPGTKSTSGVPAEAATVSPIKEITDNMTAWSHAGPAYRLGSTIYFLPTGRVLPGSRIEDWDDLPVKTRLVVGYRGPFRVSGEKTAFKIAGHKYKDPRTVYILPGGELKTGDTITDFTRLPRGTGICLPL